MQRCPYLHEMKERLLGEQTIISTEPLNTRSSNDHLHHDTTATTTPAHVPAQPPHPPPPLPQPHVMEPQPQQQQPVGTVVRLNADGYSSHTSPAHQRTPLMPREPEEEFHCVQQTSWRPKNAKTSLFIITSFIYAKLLIVICIAYVISDVVTHNLPLYYYEGFFTYLYGMSILFLLYVFCFLLQESTCCSGGQENGNVAKAKKPPPDKKLKKEKEKKEKEKEKKEKEKKEKEKDKDKSKDKDKKNKKNVQREVFPRKMRDLVAQRAAGPRATQDTAPIPQPPQQQDVEAGVVTKSVRKRKTTQNDSSHGSFFLRVGAIAFGLGTMIYNGLEFGSFFEVPPTSSCYQILRGVNPVLQMIFTFMQMYFIFMNSRLNIHRFKVVARFGLMHVVATNICVWIRTLVLEYLKEITAYHKRNHTVDQGMLGESIKSHVLRISGGVDVVHAAAPDVSTAAASLLASSTARSTIDASTMAAATTLRSVATVVRNATTAIPTTLRTTIQSATVRAYPAWAALKTTISSTLPTTTTTTIPTTTTSATTSTSTTTTTTTTTTPFPTTTDPTTTASTTDLTTNYMTSSPFRNLFNFENFNNFDSSIIEDTSNTIAGDVSNSIIADSANSILNEASNTLFGNNNNLTAILPQALISSNDTDILPATCERMNIMGTIVQDSAPYLFPFIIEYSLIGAAVIYVMWKHIGRNPRYVTEEDLEHRLEVMLSRRAVAMAQAQHGRVDCVGASKGLFFGLLLLVGSLICLILFFVLIRHPDLNMLAIYLADVSHCVLMVLSIIAIIIGFIRVQGLKFRTEEQNDLNDILLRVSAFGLFTYAVFSVIAGSLAAFTHEPNLLVMITGLLSITQVVLQLLFIADVSRRRVHLPEHDRSKPGRQVVTFLLICNVTMWIIYTFETQKVEANPVQLDFYGFLAWAIVQRVTLPLCIFHRFHSAVTLAEIWKTSYKARLE